MFQMPVNILTIPMSCHLVWQVWEPKQAQTDKISSEFESIGEALKFYRDIVVGSGSNIIKANVVSNDTIVWPIM